MSGTCFLSESSSGCGCSYTGAGAGGSALAAAGFLPLTLHDSNALSFPTQPIVYYAGLAETPELYNMKQKGHEKRNKPNHFVKAFRWYSREHGANENTVAQTPDIGFASWLDDKYQQYLKDKTEDASFKYKTHNVEPAAIPNVIMRKSTKPRGLRRVLRSPWRKRHPDAKMKTFEGGNGCADCVECKASWQTILRPKSLTRFDSENCTEKRSAIGGASSKVTSVTSSDTQVIQSRKRDLVVEDITKRSADVVHSGKNIRDNKTTKPKFTLFNDGGRNSTKSKNKVKCECPVEEKIEVTNNMVHSADTNTQCHGNVQYENKPFTNQVTPTRMTTKNAYTGTSQGRNDIALQKNTEGESKPLSTVTTTQTPVKSTSSINKNYQGTVVCGCPVDSADEVVHTLDHAYATTPINENDQGTVVCDCPVDSADEVVQTLDYAYATTPINENDQGTGVCGCPVDSADGVVQTLDYAYAITPGHIKPCRPLFLRIV